MRMRGWAALAGLLLLGTWGGTLGWRQALAGSHAEETGKDGAASLPDAGESGGGAAGERFDAAGTETGARRIRLERDGVSTYLDLEDYLPGVVACQIDTDLDEEALKCQAILARTYICRLMDGREEIYEEELDLDYLGGRTLSAADPAKRERLAEALERCEGAVRQTEGMVAKYEGRCILPLFHAVSAGRTRKGEADYPYLESVESRWDRDTENFERTYRWDRTEFAGLISRIPGGQPVDASQIPGQMQTVKKDDAGYMVQMKIGASTYSGEEIRCALDLPSACFSFSGVEDEIRAVVRGSGHGYGLSQAGADGMAREGWRWEDILNYYYSGIAIEPMDS